MSYKLHVALAALLALTSCTADTAPPPGYEPELEPSTPVVTLPAGKPIDYRPTNMQDSEQRPMDWRVTLTKTECGLKSIPKAVPNPKWQGEDDVPQYVTAKADPGKQFCIVYWAWENVGKEPGRPDAAGDIVVNGERYPRAGEQDEMSEHLAEQKLRATWMYEDVAPHDKTRSLDVYLIPEGAKPEAVWFPFENLVDETSNYLVATQP